MPTFCFVFLIFHPTAVGVLFQPPRAPQPPRATQIIFAHSAVSGTKQARARAKMEVKVMKKKSLSDVKM